MNTDKNTEKIENYLLNNQQKMADIIESREIKPELNLTEKERRLIYDFDAIGFSCGKYNEEECCFGSGGFIKYLSYTEDGVPVMNAYAISASSNDEELITMRDVAGELIGTIGIIMESVKNCYESILILYNYEGIKKWATGEWDCTKEWTKKYNNMYNEVIKGMNITFLKIDEDTKVSGFEEAERLAKMAVGLDV